jgi:hypothetical protein
MVLGDFYLNSTPAILNESSIIHSYDSYYCAWFHNITTMDTPATLTTRQTGAIDEQTRRRTADEWETIKLKVEQLYVKEAHTLKQLMVILKEKYGFIAS